CVDRVGTGIRHRDVGGLGDRVAPAGVPCPERHGERAWRGVDVARVLRRAGSTVAEAPGPGRGAPGSLIREQYGQWRDANRGRAREIGYGGLARLDVRA